MASIKNIFSKFLTNSIRCFSGYRVLFHLAAFALTYFLVISGFDWLYFKSTRSIILLWLFFPTIVVGEVMPFIFPMGVYIFGKRKKLSRAINTAFALGQAVIISYLTFTFYKIITGRPAPYFLHDIGTADISREFNFGFLHGSMLFGWPSGHTMWAFAMATTLFILYPESKRIRSLSFIYAIYIGLGMSVTLHWFSDFIAGALMGVAIGIVVGKYFLNRYSTLNKTGKIE